MSQNEDQHSAILTAMHGPDSNVVHTAYTQLLLCISVSLLPELIFGPEHLLKISVLFDTELLSCFLWGHFQHGPFPLCGAYR